MKKNTILNTLLHSNHFLLCLRVFISTTGIVILAWWINQPSIITTLALSVLSAATADMDNSTKGRFINLLIVVPAFFATAVINVLLFPYPVVFFIGLMCATFFFLFLSVLGQRFATIGYGTLLLAIYTMININSHAPWYQEPLLLVVGVLWYHLVAFACHFIFPFRPVRENMADCFSLLANYLNNKAKLFDPDEDNLDNIENSILIECNKQLLSALNRAKNTLYTRLNSRRSQTAAQKMLNLYFMAWDIYERANSTHTNYKALSQRFNHSDLLFRLQRLLQYQAQACQELAIAIKSGARYQHNTIFAHLIKQLDESIVLFHAENDRDWYLIRSLSNVLKNLKATNNQLQHIALNSANPSNNTEHVLQSEGLTSLHDVYIRVKQNLTLKSFRFRHALRMSIVMGIGYLVIQATHLPHGYWILLTSLFVCQPNYIATKHRLIWRVIGTILALLIGTPLLYFIPNVEGKMVIIVLCAILFFASSSILYVYATGFITLLVLTCLDIAGTHSTEVIIPRLVATLIGCIIAWFAVSYLWPDWQFRQLPNMVKQSISAITDYLNAIADQYRQGKNSSLEYRMSRLNANRWNAELASEIANLKHEPFTNKTQLDACARFLNLNHRLLSYLSSLAAHRQRLESDTNLVLFNQIINKINGALTFPDIQTDYSELRHQIEYVLSVQNDLSENDESFTFQQLMMIIDLLPDLNHHYCIIYSKAAQSSPPTWKENLSHLLLMMKKKS